MKALWKQGVEEINVKVLENIYKESTAQEVSKTIPIKEGVGHYFS